MKVALVFFHPFSESMGSVVRVRELARSLEKHGLEVYIFTPYERSFDMSPSVHVVSIDNFINSVGLSKEFYRLTKFLYYSKAFAKFFSQRELQSDRIMSRLAKGVAGILRKKGVDIVQVEQDAPLPFGISLKRELGLPLVVDLHNLSSEELVAAGVLKGGSDHFLALQRRTMRYLAETDHVIVVSDEMRDYVIDSYGTRSSDISVVPPGGRVHVDERTIQRRANPIKVVYAGLVAHRERVNLFVESMPFIANHDKDMRFYITNKGEAVKEIKKLASKLGVNPNFFWYENYDAANDFLSTCHVGVLTSSNNVARRMGTPVKLFNYMSVGLPVVANDVGGWTEIIERENIGLLTSDDPKEFGEALISIVGDPKVMQEYALNELRLIEHKYNWDNSARTLLDVYEQLSSARP